jgi:hypothetical protein
LSWFQKGWSVPESDDLSLLEMTSPAKTATLVMGVPLAQIKLIVELEPSAAAARVAEFWAGIESEHVHRSELARRLVDRLNGKRPTRYEVATREMPERRLLCLKRNVDSQAVWAFGKEFIGLLKQLPRPRFVPRRAGAMSQIFWGEVSEDSDGPVEWCLPVPEDKADSLAAQLPELTLRTEPAHEEAFVPLGTAEIDGAQSQLIGEARHDWAKDHNRLPSELGVRLTYLYEPPRAADTRPDIDFAVPLRDRSHPELA